MTDLTLKLEATEYLCEPCTLRQGTPVRELVRMVPRSVVVFGKLVGNEYFCCPICFEPKFDAKTRKPVKHGQTEVAEDPRTGSAGQGPARSGVRVVK